MKKKQAKRAAKPKEYEDTLMPRDIKDVKKPAEYDLITNRHESFGYDSFASASDSEAETAREYYKAKHVLFTAVKHGNTWVVALLLSVKFPEEGAFKKCLEAVDCHGRGALNLAAALGDVSSASLLLRAGMHPRHDKRRNQPLLVACEVGSFDVAKLMVDAGSDVNAANNQV